MNIISNRFLILLLPIYAFGPVLDNLSGIRILGFSFFITFIPTILIVVLFLLNINVFKSKDNLLIGIIFIVSTCISVLRILAFQEQLTLKNVGNSLYSILIPMIFVLYKNFDYSTKNKRTLLIIIKMVLVFHIIISVLYLLKLPTLNYINYLSEDYYLGSEFGRFQGILAGSNVQGNFLMLVFAIVLLKSTKIHEIVVYSPLVLISVLPTLSRNAIIFTFILIVFYFLLKLKSEKFLRKLFVIIAIICVITLIIYLTQYGEIIYNIINFNERIIASNLSDIRIAKFLFATNILFSNINYFLIGIPYHLQQNSYISISDSSLTLFFARFGLPFTIYFLYSLYRILPKSLTGDTKYKVFMSMIVFTSLTNNTFIWYAWITYSVVGLFLLKSENDKLNN